MKSWNEFKQMLIEMPKNIPDLDWFELNDDETNALLYKKYSGFKYKWKKKVLRINDYATIYRHRSEFFCLDTNAHRITYYMSCSVSNNKMLGQFVWQSLVWVSDEYHRIYLNNIASQIFFEQLLPQYHTIVTDSEQSWRGKSFWRMSIAEAFSFGLHVYFCDFSNGTLEKLNSFKDLDKFQSEYDIWGETDKHMLRRMVITDKVLK